MGNTNNANSTNNKYTSIPDDMDILFYQPNGWAYYESSRVGFCNKCHDVTSHWFVEIKNSGKFLCKRCHNHS